MSTNRSVTDANPRPAWRLLALLALMTLGGIAVWVLQKGDQEVATTDASQTKPVSGAGPFLVGRAVCANCHPDEAADHERSGHFNALARTKDSPLAQTLCSTTIPAQDGYGPYLYSCDAEGLMVSVPDKFGDRKFPLDFAFGSGQHAVTFLTLTRSLDAENGVLGIEHRQTWYRKTGELGVTPGQQQWIPEREIEHFGKSLQGELLERCIQCHTTDFRMVGDQLEDLVCGIQCEACHGPGSEHVAAAQSGMPVASVLASIRTPRNSDDEIQECGRCHRMPNEIDPERLERYPPSLTRFQPIGLMRSRCYLESNGRLGCLNCHDPHGPVTDRTLDQQVSSCRECHRVNGDSLCSLGHVDDCIRCHMRSLELVPGFVVHDHWIRTRPDTDGTNGGEDEITVSGAPNDQ